MGKDIHKTNLKCKECGKDVERTKEESIELGLPSDICDACLARDRYEE